MATVSNLEPVSQARFDFNLDSVFHRVLQNSMAATYEDQGPIQNFRIEMSIFYVVYFVVFPFFFVNIFVALIIITFQEQGEAELQDGEIDKNQVIDFVEIQFLNNFTFNILPEKQKSCIDFTIGARPLERYIPTKHSGFKYTVWRIIVSAPFEYFIMSLIVFNTLLLMLKVCLPRAFSRCITTVHVVSDHAH